MGVYPEGTTVDDAVAASAVHFDEAMAYKAKGDFEGSIAPLSKAIEIDPLNTDYYFERSLSLATTGDLEKAIIDMSFVVAQDPMNARGYYYRGLMQADYGMVAEAIADLEKVQGVLESSEARDIANQTLEDLRPRLEFCQFTAFEAVNEAKDPTFAFAFQGPPNTGFMGSAFNRNRSDEDTGAVFLALTPDDGVTQTEIAYPLKEGESSPIELEVRVSFDGCHLRETVFWPDIDILAILSGQNP